MVRTPHRFGGMASPNSNGAPLLHPGLKHDARHRILLIAEFVKDEAVTSGGGRTGESGLEVREPARKEDGARVPM
jgi:hypothetical protein